MTPYYSDDLVTIYHVVDCHNDERRANASVSGTQGRRGRAEDATRPEGRLPADSVARRQAITVGR